MNQLLKTLKSGVLAIIYGFFFSGYAVCTLIMGAMGTILSGGSLAAGVGGAGYILYEAGSLLIPSMAMTAGSSSILAFFIGEMSFISLLLLALFISIVVCALGLSFAKTFSELFLGCVDYLGDQACLNFKEMIQAYRVILNQLTDHLTDQRLNGWVQMIKGWVLRALSILMGCVGAVSIVGLLFLGIMVGIEMLLIFQPTGLSILGVYCLALGLTRVGALLAEQCFKLFFSNQPEGHQGLFYTLSKQADQAFERVALDVNAAYSEQANQAYVETRGQSSDPKSEGVFETSPEQASSEHMMTVDAVPVGSAILLTSIEGSAAKNLVKVDAQYAHNDALNGTPVHGDGIDAQPQPGMNR